MIAQGTPGIIRMVCFWIIANGGGAPNSDMPAYAVTLTQTEMEAVLAYIKTFWDARDLEFQTQVTKQNEAP